MQHNILIKKNRKINFFFHENNNIAYTENVRSIIQRSTWTHFSLVKNKKTYRECSSQFREERFYIRVWPIREEKSGPERADDSLEWISTAMPIVSRITAAVDSRGLWREINGSTRVYCVVMSLAVETAGFEVEWISPCDCR